MNESNRNDGTHIAVGLSPDGFAIVMRQVVAGNLRPGYPFQLSLAELACRGRERATQKIGVVTLTLMTLVFPAINHCAAALIPSKQGKRLVINPPDKSGSIRESHLRVHVTEGPSMVFERFQGDASDDAPASMPLRLLMTQEPKGVSCLVGYEVLDALIAMHPEAFAPFPTLRVG